MPTLLIGIVNESLRFEAISIQHGHESQKGPIFLLFEVGPDKDDSRCSCQHFFLMKNSFSRIRRFSSSIFRSYSVDEIVLIKIFSASDNSVS